MQSSKRRLSIIFYYEKPLDFSMGVFQIDDIVFYCESLSKIKIDSENYVLLDNYSNCIHACMTEGTFTHYPENHMIEWCGDILFFWLEDEASNGAISLTSDKDYNLICLNGIADVVVVCVQDIFLEYEVINDLKITSCYIETDDADFLYSEQLVSLIGIE